MLSPSLLNGTGTISGDLHSVYLNLFDTAKQIVDYQIANPQVEPYADDLKRMYDEIVMKNTNGLFN